MSPDAIPAASFSSIFEITPLYKFNNQFFPESPG
jgi:hypothetical protein